MKIALKSSGLAGLVSLVLIGVLVAPPAQSFVGVEVEPEAPRAGESFQLTFHTDQPIDDPPDFSALENILRVLGVQSQTSIRWVNGKQMQTKSWAVSVIAEQTGPIEIPSFRIGSFRSPRRTIIVGASADRRSGSVEEILLQVEVDNDRPYVQQQVIYTVRLLHRVQLSSPRLSQVTSKGDAVIKALDKGRQFATTVDGHTYEGYEQRYAIFPQASGTLTIEPIQLSANIVVGRRSFFDPLGSVSPRSLLSEALTVNVQPIPADYPDGAAWLPAKRLRFYDEWTPEETSISIGAPLERTIRLWADGLIAGQLPEFELPAVPGAKIYADKPQTNEQNLTSGFTAVRQEKYAVVPNQAGEVAFPALRLPWWNTQTDALEYAEVQPRLFSVNRNADPPGATPPAKPSVVTNPDLRAVVPGAELWRWQAAAAVLLAFWLITVVAWWKSTATRRDETSGEDFEHQENTAKAYKRFEHACRANDPQAAMEALRVWFQHALSTNARPTINTIRHHVDKDFAAALQILEEHCYANADRKTKWQGSVILGLSREILKKQKKQNLKEYKESNFFKFAEL